MSLTLAVMSVSNVNVQTVEKDNAANTKSVETNRFWSNRGGNTFSCGVTIF